MKKRIIVLIYLLLCVIQTTVNAQPIPNQDYMNQAKYWFYRNRLINEFCKVGPNQGESIPFQSMNYVTHYGNAGDGGIQKLGHYIGVLATEIKLLRNSNQSTSKTVEELFYALYAAYRLDATAETYDFCYDVDAENAKPKIQNDYPYYSKCQGDPGSWNGFMLRDDKNPKSSSAIYNHFKNMTGITNFQCDFGLNIAPYGQTTIEVSNHASTLNDASHDQLGNLLIGLRLVQFCLNGTEYYTYSGTSYNLKQFSTNIASILMGYLAAGSPNNTVNCNYINNMMGAPSQLTKWYSYLLPVGVSNCSSVGPFVNGSGNIPWLFSNTVINQPSSIENDDIGGAFPYFLSEGYALTGKQLTGQSYTTTKISKIAWNEFPRTLSKSIYQLGDSWKILSLASISDGWTSSYIPCGILPVACTTKVCIAKTIWNGKCVLSVPVPAKCTANIDCVSKDFVLYDQCWRANFQVLPLMYNVLNNKIGFNSVGGSPASTTAYINFFQSHIDNAPCRGPYCMGANDKAANDWASWSILLSADAGNNHKWTDGPDGGGGTDLGEYNGLDYMLMYNLYNIYNNKTNYYVNYDNNLALTNRTITSPEYYNARSYTDYDDPAHGHYYGTIINGVLTASSVTVSQGGYLNLRAGASITLSPPFTASGTMQASIYRPEKNYEWEMSICSDGAPVGNAIPSGHREAAINETNYFSMEDYLASKALEKSDVVTSSLLEDAYPNPAAGTTSIPYKIAAEESVEIFILDANGNKVSTLVKKEKHPTGEYSVDYNTSLLSPGVYYYTLKTASYSKTKKLVIIK